MLGRKNRARRRSCSDSVSPLKASKDISTFSERSYCLNNNDESSSATELMFSAGSSTCPFNASSERSDQLSILSSSMSNTDDSSAAEERERVRPRTIKKTQRRVSNPCVLENTMDMMKAAREVELISARIRFDSLKICGRDKEKEILSRVLKRVQSPEEGGKELVLVHGLSGSGKTSLVSTMENKVKRLNGAYAVGKFGLHSDEPYEAFNGACRQICGNLLMLQKEGKKDVNSQFRLIQSLLCEKLRSEIHLLATIFPELLEVLDDGSQTIPPDLNGDIDNEKTKPRLHLAFRTFFKVVAEHMLPLVVVLDDVQWADPASLELLSILATDVDNKKLVFICTYRSDEVDEDHPFLQLVKNFKGDEVEIGLKITEIEVGSLTIEAVNEILMELLSCENPEKSLELAELCHRRTHGNSYFVLALLRNLRDEKLLKFHHGSYQWQWDIQAILDNTSATDNVVELMKREIERLPDGVRKCLTYAACLSTTFEPYVLDLVWDAISIPGKEDEDAKGTWLELAVRGGFIESTDPLANTIYQWIHDSVREAVLGLVPLEDLAKHKAALGMSLMERLTKEQLQSMVFVVANLVHEGQLSVATTVLEGESSTHNGYALSERADNVECCRLNLEAALKASKVSAFDSAAKYAERGIDLLPADRWRSLYTLTLALYTVAVEAEAAIGRRDLVELYYEEVIAQTDRPIVDKLPVYTTLVFSCLADENWDRGIELGLIVLDQLGVRFPKGGAMRFASILSGLSRWMKKGKSITAEEIAALPKMENPIHQSIMRLLNAIALMSVRSQNHLSWFLLGTFKMLSLTFEHGTSDYSPYAFSLLGVMFSSVFGNYELGNEIATLTEDMTYNVKSTVSVALTLVALTTYCKLWVEPIPNSLGPYMRAYKAGISCGDTDGALMAVSQVVLGSFVTGRPLPQIENDCRLYGSQAREFERTVSLSLFKIFWLVVVKLMGGSHDDLAGLEPTTSMDELPEKLNGMEKIDLANIDALKIVLHAIFGENLEGVVLSLKNENSFTRYNPGHFLAMQETFSRCLCFYAMARQTKSAKYQRHAWKLHKIVKKWRSKGNPNVIHHDILLDAEHAAFKGEFDTAELLYQKAKTIASRSGLTLDAALASERYGEFLLATRRNRAEVAYKFNAAIMLYGEIGANAKVEQIRERYFWDPWPEIPDEIALSDASPYSQ